MRLIAVLLRSAQRFVEQVKSGHASALLLPRFLIKVNKGLLQGEKIAQAVNEKKIGGISDMRDRGSNREIYAHRLESQKRDATFPHRLF